MAIIPKINCGYFKAWPLSLEIESSDSTTASGLSGKEENFRKTATNKKAAPNIKYGIFTLSISNVVLLEVAEPKIAKLTINGPIVVPKLLIPPANVNRY